MPVVSIPAGEIRNPRWARIESGIVAMSGSDRSAAGRRRSGVIPMSTPVADGFSAHDAAAARKRHTKVAVLIDASPLICRRCRAPAAIAVPVRGAARRILLADHFCASNSIIRKHAIDDALRRAAW